MPQVMDEVQEFESNTVGIYRTAATVKGGRRFSFSALVVVGDRSGRVGAGYGKANQVPNAIEKAQKEARRKAKRYPLQGRTIPHVVTGRFGACLVRLVPASPGTGVIAGAAVRAVLEMLGVQDCLTKSFGSSNPKNLVKATLNGLSQLRNKETVESLRGVQLEKTQVEETIERGAAFMPVVTSRPEKEETLKGRGDGEKGKGKKGGRRRGGRGRGGAKPEAGARPPAGGAPSGRRPAGKPKTTERKVHKGSQTAPPEGPAEGKPVSMPRPRPPARDESPAQGAKEASPPPPPDESQAKSDDVREKSEPS